MGFRTRLELEFLESLMEVSQLVGGWGQEEVRNLIDLVFEVLCPSTFVVTSRGDNREEGGDLLDRIWLGKATQGS